MWRHTHNMNTLFPNKRDLLASWHPFFFCLCGHTWHHVQSIINNVFLLHVYDANIIIIICLDFLNINKKIININKYVLILSGYVIVLLSLTSIIRSCNKKEPPVQTLLSTCWKTPLLYLEVTPALKHKELTPHPSLWWRSAGPPRSATHLVQWQNWKMMSCGGRGSAADAAELLYPRSSRQDCKREKYKKRERRKGTTSHQEKEVSVEDTGWDVWSNACIDHCKD